MSIKQTEAPDEVLLLLLPAAAKWMSSETYRVSDVVSYTEFKKSFGRLLKRTTLPELKLHLNQSGTASVTRKVGLDLDTLTVNYPLRLRALTIHTPTYEVGASSSACA